MYWPMNDTSSMDVVLPSVQECEPLPKEQVLTEMTTRWEKSTQYLESLGSSRTTKELLTDKLEPVQSREQKLFWNKSTKVFDLKLVPHWSSRFCPYPDELCNCSEQGVNKIGHYHFVKEFQGYDIEDWVYEARNGYEDVEPLDEPSKQEKAKHLKEALADG